MLEWFYNLPMLHVFLDSKKKFKKTEDIFLHFVRFFVSKNVKNGPSEWKQFSAGKMAPLRGEENVLWKKPYWILKNREWYVVLKNEKC